MEFSFGWKFKVFGKKFIDLVLLKLVLDLVFLNVLGRESNVFFVFVVLYSWRVVFNGGNLKFFECDVFMLCFCDVDLFICNNILEFIIEV